MTPLVLDAYLSVLIFGYHQPSLREKLLEFPLIALWPFGVTTLMWRYLIPHLIERYPPSVSGVDLQSFILPPW